uniref:Uncharacterized protein n=1 Tax=Arundo donax TaxID=35708 RepID=A0A0A9FBJ8_ARUDO
MSFASRLQQVFINLHVSGPAHIQQASAMFNNKYMLRGAENYISGYKSTLSSMSIQWELQYRSSHPDHASSDEHVQQFGSIGRLNWTYELLIYEGIMKKASIDYHSPRIT